jgi:cell division protein FtsB
MSKIHTYIFFWAFIVVTCSIAVIFQLQEKGKYTDRIQFLNARLAQENALHTDLQNQIVVSENDSNTEAQIRNEFGFVYPDEIIFYDDSYDNGTDN